MRTELSEQLTTKQAQVLAFIDKEISARGRSPSFRDIARHFGFGAVGTVQGYVRALLKKGYLDKTEDSGPCGFRLPRQTEIMFVPVLGSAPAGSPMEALPQALGSIPFAGRWRSDLYALKVKNESMRDCGIYEGDYVIARKASDADNGRLIVAVVDGETTVKKLDKKRSRIRLLSAHPKFKPIDLEPSRENRIAGIVVGVQRYY